LSTRGRRRPRSKCGIFDIILGPSLTQFSVLCHPARDIRPTWCPCLSDADWCFGACNPMMWMSPGLREFHCPAARWLALQGRAARVPSPAGVSGILTSNGFKVGFVSRFQSIQLVLFWACNSQGQAGRICVLGGSVDYAGAPFYAGMSALRAATSTSLTHP